MNLGKPILFISLVICTAIAVYSSHKSEKISYSSTSTSSLQESASVPNSRKNKEIPSNLLKSDALKHEAKMVQSLNEVTTLDTDSQPIDEVLKELIINEAEALYNWLNDSLLTSSDFDLNREMQIGFERESINVFWAEEQEAKMQNVFNVNSDFSGIALKEVSCRSTQCRLSIAITDMDQANTLVELVSKAVQDEQPYSTVIATPDEQAGVTKIYISNDRNSFAFH